MAGTPTTAGTTTVVGDEEVRELLRGHGLRRTSQRLAVLDALAHSHRFLRPAEVYDELRQRQTRVDRATVYRTLSTMVVLGVVRTAVHPPGLVAYGLASGSPNQAVCTSCGSAVELPDDSVAWVIAEVGAAAGLVGPEMSVTIHGICVECHRA